MTNAAPATAVESAVPSFKVFPAEISAVQRLSPSLVRITVGGSELTTMTSGGLDQRIKLLFPRAGQTRPHLPTDDPTFAGIRRVPAEIRPAARTYTVRTQHPGRAEFDIDMVLHGDVGPGSSFAGGARLGRPLGIIGPNAEYPHGERFGGVEFRLDKTGTRVILVGDETTLPAVGSILESLPAGVRVDAVLEVPQAADAQVFYSAADVHVTWMCRNERGSSRRESVLDWLRELTVDAGDCYAWVGGEAGMVKAARRCLINERGVPRDAVTFMGYWRRGRTEDARAGH